MRDWGVNPSLLCNQHLLGNHCELHMMVGTINNGISIKGYIDEKLIDTSKIKKRHEDLVKEMKKRNMNHKSELNYKDKLKLGKLDIQENLNELCRRCEKCKQKIKGEIK